MAAVCLANQLSDPTLKYNIAINQNVKPNYILEAIRMGMNGFACMIGCIDVVVFKVIIVSHDKELE